MTTETPRSQALVSNGIVVAECPYHQGYFASCVGLLTAGALFECDLTSHPYPHASGRLMYPDYAETGTLLFVAQYTRPSGMAGEEEEDNALG